MSSKEKEPIQLLQGTLDLIVLRTLATMGSQHAYQIATRLQQVSDRLLNLNQGTLYPALVARAVWVDQGNVGKDREQPGSQILRHHQSRTEGSGQGDGEMETNGGSGGAALA